MHPGGEVGRIQTDDLSSPPDRSQFVIWLTSDVNEQTNSRRIGCPCRTDFYRSWLCVQYLLPVLLRCRCSFRRSSHHKGPRRETDSCRQIRHSGLAYRKRRCCLPYVREETPKQIVMSRHTCRINRVRTAISDRSRHTTKRKTWSIWVYRG
jgi:hypothetical protein